jgi:hypothetical protein
MGRVCPAHRLDNNNKEATMHIYILALVIFLVFTMLTLRWDRPYLETQVITPERNRRDLEIECSTHRLVKIRESRLPEEVRQHLMLAAVLELRDLYEGKQRPWDLDYLLFGVRPRS